MIFKTVNNPSNVPQSSVRNIFIVKLTEFTPIVFSGISQVFEEFYNECRKYANEQKAMCFSKI